MTTTPSDPRLPVRPPVPWPDFFDRSIWFAHLLRSDVRGTLPPDDPEGQRRFLVWWAIDGRRDYGGALLTAGQRDVLWEPVPWDGGASGSLRVPRLLAAMLDRRPDVVSGIGLWEPGGGERLEAWLFCHGLQEFNVADALDGTRLARLWDPVAEEAGGLPFPRLARLAWALRRDLQPYHDIATPEGRASFALWFFTHGLVGMGFGGLLPHRLRQRLLDRIVPGEGQPSLPLFAWMAARAGLPGAPAAGGPEDAAAAAAWFQREGRAAFERATDGRPRVQARPAAGARPPRAGFGVNILGFAHGEFGIGEDVRMTARALQAADVPFQVVDLGLGLNTRTADETLAPHLGDDFPFAVTVVCATLFDLAHYRLVHGDAGLAGRYVVAYSPWELPDWPAAWSPALELVDEIWASSRFAQDSFAASAFVPVQHMPLAVELGPVTPLGPEALGLAPGQLTFLFTFDANSYLVRKNPGAVAAAFRSAFPAGDAPVQLLFKVMNADGDPPGWQQFLAACGGDPRIRIVARTLDRAQVLGLTAMADVYVSLHRAEGFGRTIAEAMLLGKPVVATGWSGSDACVTAATALPVRSTPVPLRPGDYPWAEGTHWAEPDIAHAAECLRLLAASPELRARLGRAGREHVAGSFAPAVVGARIRARLERIVARLG